jgi:hypothetical protein
MIVNDLISQVAVRLGDPRMTRNIKTDLTAFYNQAIEEITLGWKVLEEDATTDVQANERRYSYPDECVQLRRVRFNPTPIDDTTGWNLIEDFWEEHRSHTNRYIEKNEPRHYCVRANFFELRPMPTADVTDGLFVSYWKLGTPVVFGEESNTSVELSSTFQKYLRDYTAIFAKEKSGRYQEAAADRTSLEADLDRVAGRLEDKSDDRRSQLRPRSVHRFGRQN